MHTTGSASPVEASESSDTEENVAAAAGDKERSDSRAVNILYEVEWSYGHRAGKYTCEEDPCQDTEIHRPPKKKPRCVISVSIVVKGISVESDHADLSLPYGRDVDPGWGAPRYAPLEAERQPGKDFKAISIAKTAVKIHSLHLLQAIRELVRYYPTQSLKGDIITVTEPYAMLLHYFHDLKKLRDVHLKNADQDSTDAEIIHDLTILIDWLEPYYVSSVKEEEERYKRGVATYQALWYLYKPGSSVYTQVDGNWRSFVVHSYNFGSQFIVWYLAHNGKQFVRRNKSFILGSFEGEKNITSLRLIPSQYLDNATKIQALLESRGQRYYDVMRNLPQHLRYSGDALAGTGFKRLYEGEIMVDPESWSTRKDKTSKGNRDPGASYSFNPDSDTDRTGDEFSTHSDEDVEVRHREGRSNQKDVCDSLAEWMQLKSDQKNDPTSVELTPHQRSLLPTQLRGFALKDKLWMQFELENAHSFVRGDRDSVMKNLILPSEDLQLISALSRKHIRLKASPLLPDFVHGKGEGLILLLHGPPGTGKTFTVECFADYTRRPLLSLTVADIGTKEESMEARLSDWFNLATRWEAILLIDEADIFLERRSLSDLARNSLVSVFLRTMEYYKGMLFLTTNRVGHLDDAFLSRIQVAITYEKLSTESQRRIWARFFAKLTEESPDVTVSWEAQRHVEDEETIKSMDMNGRDIRNALQIAVALARDRADRQKRQTAEVTIDDMKQVVSRRRRFTAYINDIRKASEGERALSWGDRNDESRQAASRPL